MLLFATFPDACPCSRGHHAPPELGPQGDVGHCGCCWWVLSPSPGSSPRVVPRKASFSLHPCAAPAHPGLAGVGGGVGMMCEHANCSITRLAPSARADESLAAREVLGAIAGGEHPFLFLPSVGVSQGKTGPRPLQIPPSAYMASAITIIARIKFGRDVDQPSRGRCFPRSPRWDTHHPPPGPLLSPHAWAPMALPLCGII